MTDPQCRCCRVTIPLAWGAMRQRLRICPICDACNERHGFALHAEIVTKWQSGVIDTWHAIAASVLDDAWISGLANIYSDGSIVIPRPVKRWEAAIAWARVQRAHLPFGALVDAVLAPYFGARATVYVRASIERDMHAAVCAWDPKLRNVKVQCPPVDVISGDLKIDVSTEAGDPDQTGPRELLDVTVAGVDVPIDILSRPRGQA